MISSNDFRTGVTIEVDGEVYSVVEFQHVKPGKGSAFVRTKLKNVKTGSVLERTFAAGEKLPRAHLERKEVQYLYNSDGEYVVMDSQTYEQFNLTGEQIGDGVKFLKENMTMWVLTHAGAIMGVEIPNFVELEVVETEPGFKGDTATGGTKPAKLETGAIVKVPLFVNIGDKIRVDTRTGTYLERA
ncbi:MAG: elongation factor P [Firmicutes bacterium]|nr:elongation factor P [Bacillota bacterium]